MDKAARSRARAVQQFAITVFIACFAAAVLLGASVEFGVVLTHARKSIIVGVGFAAFCAFLLFLDSVTTERNACSH